MNKTTPFKYCRFLLIFLLFFSFSSTAQQSQVFATPGTTTYTVPAGVYQITAEAWGAGGAGGTRTSNGYSGGGGGGAYARSTITVTPGATYNVTVGAAGRTFGTERDSWFDSSTILLAKGGSTVANNNTAGATGGRANESVGTITRNGGNGSNSASSRSGAGGSSAGPMAAGNNASNANGGVAPVGGGKGAGASSNATGNIGSSPGGGGSGIRRNISGTINGGLGGNGQVIITPNYRNINITGNGTTVVAGNTTPSVATGTNFGTANVTNGTVVRTFTIENTGNLDMTISSITVSGTNAADFAASVVAQTVISGGSSTTFTATFNPNALGVKNAIITVAHNVQNKPAYTFAVTGTGTNPEIEVTGNNQIIQSGQIAVSASNFTQFNTVELGAAASTRQFVVRNLASAQTALKINGVTISGPNASDFTITTAPAATVAVNGSTTITIAFNPSAIGLRTAVVNIANDDADENPYTFVIAGTVTSADVVITGNSVAIVSGDTSPSLADHTNFGGVNTTGTASRTRTFTIRNTSVSGTTLNIGAITITGTHANNFTVTSNPATSLSAGSTTTFSVKFDPSAQGLRTANISIVNNAPGKNPYFFTVSGTGSNPEIAITGNGVAIIDGATTISTANNTDFGTVSIDNGFALATYTIRNTGATALFIGDISFTGSAASSFSIESAPPSSVAASGSTTFQVKFSPQTVGTQLARIVIENDDATESPYDFAIGGLAVRTYPDTDGDGIADNLDIDDDNDGILDVYEELYCNASPISTQAEHIFLNETFGTGAIRGGIDINIPGATSTYCYEDGIVGANQGVCDMQSDWSLNDGEYTVFNTISGTQGSAENLASWSHTNWTKQKDHTGDVNGRMAIFNASYTPQIFYETRVSGIMPNVPIRYSFWVLNIMSKSAFAGTILPNITVQFIDNQNDVIISTFTTGNIGRCSAVATDSTCELSQWQQFSTSVDLGYVTSFTIRFINNATGGNGNDLALDDIIIKQEYCDYDGDGVSNLFDLDSDNDGIPDIEEAGFAYLSNGRGMMELNPLMWRDENRNGMHDEIDDMIEDGSYALPDSDFDGLPDYLDLDSDNDGIFDVDEAGLANGDGDVDGNGTGDGIDTDQDGFLDVFDAFVGRGTAVRPYAQVTSAYGIPDYQNVDSNDDGIFDIVGTLYAEFDEYQEGSILGYNDEDRDGILDEVDSATNAMGSPRNFNKKLYLNLDGRNDYATGPQLLSGLQKSTIMGWIKLSNPYGVNGTLFGQSNFYMRVNSARQLIASANGHIITSDELLDLDRWYHVAAVYDGGASSERLKLFVNGKKIKTSNAGTLSGGLTPNSQSFTIGKNASDMSQFFKGDMDEVRVFNTALTEQQLQKMVYQEVQKSGTFIRGQVIPRDIEESTWNSMIGYFRMDVFKNDVIDNMATASVDIGTNPNFFRIYNVKNIWHQQAPMPFQTIKSDVLSEAVKENEFIHGEDVTEYDWSILRINHDIDLPSNHTDLGLFIAPSVKVRLTDNNVLRNTWFLKLDGDLDLINRAQLVQTDNSILDASSTGKIERDQQGQTNMFNYNYWSSPVSTPSATTNNGGYSIANVMKDGTNPSNYLNLQWISNFNATPSSPITLSNRWLYKFQNLSQLYANWTALTPTTTLSAGEGFTMKGSAVPAESQNYVFVGKPNNGDITLPISANNQNLTGNPYPSALDANKFIQANLGSTTGTLLIWEHYTTNFTHNLHEYQGGYATRTLVGGTPPVAPVEVSGLGSSTRIPGRFIPVGQGFFIIGNATGGTVKFKNDQRAFVREENIESNSMFKDASLLAASPNLSNQEDYFEEDTYAKIRLSFISANNYSRQLLLGFMDDMATEDLDPGYDGILIESTSSDAYFTLGDKRLNIQGAGYFNPNNIYPLGVKTHMNGEVKIVLADLEHFDDTQSIFIYDSQTDIYHNLRQAPFAMVLPIGVYDRFSLRFTDSLLDVKDQVSVTGITITHSASDSMLNVLNSTDIEVQKLDLYNIVGQHIKSVKVEQGLQPHTKIPVDALATGTYIAKVTTSVGVLTTKLIIE